MKKKLLTAIIILCFTMCGCNVTTIYEHNANIVKTKEDVLINDNNQISCDYVSASVRIYMQKTANKLIHIAINLHTMKYFQMAYKSMVIRMKQVSSSLVRIVLYVSLI